MKKSQIQAQIFVYVLAMIVIALVLLYGYRGISTMKDRAKQIDILSFKGETMKAIEKVSNDYGTVRVPILNAPPEHTEICFIDMQGHSPAQDLESEHPLVYEAWGDESANVFLINDLVEESFLIGDKDNYLIAIDPPHYLCMHIKNREVKIKIEGIGGKAKLSLPE